LPIRTFIASIVATSLFCFASAAGAQMSAAPIVSALPDITSVSTGNVAGVLHYCLGRHLISHSAADIVLRPLEARRDLIGSPDYVAGTTGHIIAGGKSFSIGRASSHLQSQSCDRVLRHAQRTK